VKIASQGSIVAKKTVEYLANHPEIDHRISKNPDKVGKIRFLTTDSAEFFEKGATPFWEEPVKAESVCLNLLYSNHDYSHTD
jgi:glutamate racemase